MMMINWSIIVIIIDYCGRINIIGRIMTDGRTDGLISTYVRTYVRHAMAVSSS